MIDDRQTCDVCGEEFNEDRPHREHVPKKPGDPNEEVLRQAQDDERNGDETRTS